MAEEGGRGKGEVWGGKEAGSGGGGVINNRPRDKAECQPERHTWLTVITIICAD